MTANLNKLCLCLYCNLCGDASCFLSLECAFQNFCFNHLFFVKLPRDFTQYLRCCSLLSNPYSWFFGAELILYSALHLWCYQGFSLPFSGIRVCCPQFMHVITICGSLLCWMRIRQFTPGKIKLLQVLQMKLLYCLGIGSLVLIAMLRAIFTYRCANSGSS